MHQYFNTLDPYLYTVYAAHYFIISLNFYLLIYYNLHKKNFAVNNYLVSKTWRTKRDAISKQIFSRPVHGKAMENRENTDARYIHLGRVGP